MQVQTRTFEVRGTDDTKLVAEQLATFAYYIGGEQFRFVVTKLPHEPLPSVTHRASGSRVCGITANALIASLNDAKVAGMSAIKQLCDKHGEARIASVLRAAE